MKLTLRLVEKPWGRRLLPAPFANTSDHPVGEIWFEDHTARDLPFLAKYLFTSERLSVQVHPNDAQAAALGCRRGKAECWYVVETDPGAEIGLGLTCSVGPDALRSAALDGSIMDLLDWRTVSPGDFFYVPAGTVHAIGAGVSLLEFQQNSDLTYRLFDYGRPRELHLDEAIAVAAAVPFDNVHCRNADFSGSVLYSGEDFTVVMADRDFEVPAALEQRLRWVLPLSGTVAAAGVEAGAGECLLVEPGERIELSQDCITTIAAGGRI